MLKKSYRFLFAALLAMLFFCMAACSPSVPAIDAVATAQVEETANITSTVAPEPAHSATPAPATKAPSTPVPTPTLAPATPKPTVAPTKAPNAPAPATPAPAKVPATPVPTSAPVVSETTSQRNAVKSAISYIKYMAFSYEGLISQLEYEKYSHEDAVYGAEKFTSAQAQYGADNCGADWMEQAVKSAKSYLTYMSFSRSGLIDQLEYEGFTHEQAVYGVEQNGL